MDPAKVMVGRPRARQVLGCMNDIVLACEHIAALEEGLPDLDMVPLHRRLQRNIVSARGYQQPIELVTERIASG